MAEDSCARFLKRNHDMVDASDIVLGCLDTRIDFHYDRSGTAATLKYAEAHGKEIFLNTPKKMENVERRKHYVIKYIDKNDSLCLKILKGDERLAKELQDGN